MAEAEKAGQRVIYMDGETWESRLDALYGCSSELPVLIGDVSTNRGSSRLLKFVEESHTPVACFASTDNFDRVFLSRFMEITKEPLVVVNQGNVVGAVLGVMQKDEGDKQQDLRSVLAREAPGALPLVHYLRRSRLPAKIKMMGI